VSPELHGKTASLPGQDVCLRDAAPCSVVHPDRRFRGTYCFHHQGRSLSGRIGGRVGKRTLSSWTLTCGSRDNGQSFAAFCP
jgi:hypothetical protein